MDSARHFGTDRLAQALARRIEQALTTKAGAEPALVIGVFGEWGSGKSTLLGAVRDRLGVELAAAEANELPTRYTVPVWFNAWQYEREPHLVIPLLKIAKLAVDAAFAAGRTSDERLREAFEAKGDLLTDLTVAAAQSLDIKLAVPGVGSVALDAPWKFWKFFKERRKERGEEAQTGIERLGSMQYDFHQHLRAFTGADSKLFAAQLARLRRRADVRWVEPQGDDELAKAWRRATQFRLELVFFIDDLDRCLPDKAVEMLEAIKLFLEVEGCAFMLAVDDEVVERGIAHRYRDYLFQAVQSNGEDAPAARARQHFGRNAQAPSVPITGAEYLEKIVQLPVRLTRPTSRQVERFLLEEYASLFGLTVAAPNAATAGPNAPTAAALSAEARQLLNLLLEVVPPVPRKLVRAIELQRTYAALLAARGVQVDLRLLFVLVALQLFAPELYRFLRRRGAYLLRDLAQWSREGRLGDLDALARENARTLRRADEDLYHLESHAALPALVRRVQDNRAGFDLRRLLDAMGQLWPENQPSVWTDLQDYFELCSSRDLDTAAVGTPAAASAGSAPTPASSATGAAPDDPFAAPDDARTVIVPPVRQPMPAGAAAPAPASAPAPAPGAARPPATKQPKDAIEVIEDLVTAVAGTPAKAAPVAPRWLGPGEVPDRLVHPWVRENARLENPASFIDGLSANEPRAWDDALAREAPALRDKLLSREDFERLLARLKSAPRRGGATRDWLRYAETIGPYLGAEASMQLAALAWPELAEPPAEHRLK